MVKKTPKQINSKPNLTFNSITPQEGIVIKPKVGSGSQGVYLVYDKSYILSLRDKKVLKSWKELNDAIKSDLIQDKIKRDDFLIEELVFDKKQMPVDIKFYTLYGQVKMILIISIDHNLNKCYSWLNRDGIQIYPGPYQDKFDSENLESINVNEIEQVGSEIPAPFIRIDCLHGENIYFGEFTPRPGSYRSFKPEYDEWLGDEFHKAQNRLFVDLLEGKEFEAYKEVFLA